MHVYRHTFLINVVFIVVRASIDLVKIPQFVSDFYNISVIVRHSVNIGGRFKGKKLKKIKKIKRKKASTCVEKM